MIISAGIINYRFKNGEIQFLLCKNGGPFWKNIERSWNFPKGQIEPNENAIETARREFEEETGLIIPKNIQLFKLGECINKNNTKLVHTYAFEHDYGDDVEIKSNMCEMEWPTGSGRMIEVPELSEGHYMNFEQGMKSIFVYQQSMLLLLNERSFG